MKKQMIKNSRAYGVKVIVWALFYACSVFAYAGGGSDMDFEYAHATFDAYKNGKKMKAKVVLDITREAEVYTVNFKVKHWLADIYKQSVFQWNDCQSIPISSSTKLKSLVNRTEKVRFNADNTVAHYTNDDGEKDIAIDGDTLDGMSFFLEARCDFIQGKKSVSYPIVRKGKVQNMTYEVTGMEKIKTALGEFDAIKVTRKRGSKSRETSFWIAPKLGYMIVQIYHYESNMLQGKAILKSLDIKFRP